QRDGDERVGLVVPQPDVEARAVLLDERLLGEQRLGLAADDDAVDRGDLAGHRGVAAGAEVVRDALAYRDRLADVDHAAGAVPEQVDARLVRESAPGGLEGGGLR